MGNNFTATQGTGFVIPTNGQLNGGGSFEYMEYTLSAPGGNYPGTATISSTANGGNGEVSITP